MARQAKQAKPELVLVYWPEAASQNVVRNLGIFGNGEDYNGTLSGSASFNVALRGILPDPDAYIGSDSECSAMSDLILRLYVSADNGARGASADLMFNGIYYAGPNKIETYAKLIKRLDGMRRKAEFYGGRSDVLTVLAQACEVYGIKRAIVYRSGQREREFMPLAVVLAKFAEAINARCDQLGGFQRRAAND